MIDLAQGQEADVARPRHRKLGDDVADGPRQATDALAVLLDMNLASKGYNERASAKEVFMCLAIPGRVAALLDEENFALVEVSGVRRKVNVALLEGLEPDDWVLIHVGFAMSKIGAAEAEEQMQLLAMLGEAEQALEEVRNYGAVEEAEGEP